jgi:radical SAM protein with 4Fe4S-binding SPASM domain
MLVHSSIYGFDIMSCSNSPEKQNGPLMITSWRATGACNLNCLYCNVNACMKPSPGELSTSEALNLVDQVYEFGSQWFGLKGGEPLVRKDIFEIIGHARSLGLRVCLLTNGYFVDGDIYDNLVKYDVYTSVSIDGPEKVTDILRGKGSYKAALSAIKKLSEGGILNGLSMAATSINYKEAEHIFNLADEYGARFVWFNHLVPSGRAHENVHLEPTPEQYEWFLNNVYDLTKRKYKNDFGFHIHCPFYARIVKQRDPDNFPEWYKNEFTGKCIYFLFGGYLSVLENGDVIPCFYSEGLKIGNIKEKTLCELWEEVKKSEFYPQLQDPKNLKGKCGGCEYRDICGGGCRNRAHAQTGDWFGSDLACAHIPDNRQQNSLHTCMLATSIACAKKTKHEDM